MWAPGESLPQRGTLPIGESIRESIGDRHLSIGEPGGERVEPRPDVGSGGPGQRDPGRLWCHPHHCYF